MHPARLATLIIGCILYAGAAYGDPPLPPLPASPPPEPPVTAAAEPAAQTPITILSIIPAQGEPGMDVTLSGSGFTRSTMAYLGATELQTSVANQNLLSFRIPNIPPGLYALYVRKENGIISKSYNFAIQAARPTISDLVPDTIYACSTGKDREVKIIGTHFREKSLVIFDGAAVRTRFMSDEMLSFQAPRADGNLHKVQVKNPDDTVSGVLTLAIENRPEIENVRQTGDSVNYYNLIIEGRNFQQNSSIVVSEPDTVQLDRERTIVKRMQVGIRNSEEREQVSYSSCTQLVYERHPFSPINKTFSIQVINPSGEESSVVQVSAP